MSPRGTDRFYAVNPLLADTYRNSSKVMTIMLPEVSALIKLFNLKPLAIENTLFAQTYVSEIKIGDHPISSAMIGLYCETPLSVSLFHKLTFDEVWHYYAGDPFRLILLYPDGSSRDIIMSNDP